MRWAPKAAPAFFPYPHRSLAEIPSGHFARQRRIDILDEINRQRALTDEESDELIRLMDIQRRRT